MEIFSVFLFRVLFYPANTIRDVFSQFIPRMKSLSNLFVCLMLAGLFGVSCKKEKFFTGQTKLQISTDTVWFDTLFTKEPGTKYPISVTKIFSVRNKENATVKASFSLSGGTASPYRINVDGVAGPEIRDIEIGPKDSVFVFVQCTLEANNTLNPVLVTDSLITRVNGGEQKTYLAAWGWDAHYFHSVILPCNETWSDKTKPFVIIDNVLVEKGCTFTIKEGVKVYNSARSVLIVAGTLTIAGTETEPVVFSGDKPTWSVAKEPNQWGGIYLTVGSTGNTIKNASIRNATIGVRVDSLPISGSWNLELENTEFMYCGQACVAGITANIRAQNCLFAQTGTYSFAGLLGGNYDLRHCTFYTDVNFGTRNNGHFALTNTWRDDQGRILKTAALSCNLYNSIIDGNLTEELSIDDKGSASFSTDIRQNLIRSKSKPFAGNTWNQDPLFHDTRQGDFNLDTLSPAINAGMVLSPAILKDMKGRGRSVPPDLGCLERQ